jgi:hypothetical protein
MSVPVSRTAALALALALLAGVLAFAPAVWSAPAKTCQSTTSSGRLVAGSRTSCAFARTAERFINAHGMPRRVRLRSPVTHKRYTLVRSTPSTSPTGYRYVSRRHPGLWVRELY